MAVQVDMRIGEIESGKTNSPFGKALSEIRKGRYEVIDIPTYADLRVQAGRESHIAKITNYVNSGMVCTAGHRPFFVRTSPLIEDPNLAKQAMKANKGGKYFMTANTELYDEVHSIAVEDSSKRPADRRALILPSGYNFSVSEDDPEILEGILGENWRKYFDAMGLESLRFDSVNLDSMSSQRGTLVTQIAFGGVYKDRRSPIIGDSVTLNQGKWVRGVRRTEGDGKAEEIWDSSKINDFNFEPMGRQEANKLALELGV